MTGNLVVVARKDDPAYKHIKVSFEGHDKVNRNGTKGKGDRYEIATEAELLVKRIHSWQKCCCADNYMQGRHSQQQTHCRVSHFPIFIEIKFLSPTFL